MKVDLAKKRAISEIQHRADYDTIKCITHKEVFYEEHKNKKKELITQVMERNDVKKNSEEYHQMQLLDLDHRVEMMNLKTKHVLTNLEKREDIKNQMKT